MGSEIDPFIPHPIALVQDDPALDESRLARIIRIVTWLNLGMALEAMALAVIVGCPGATCCRRCCSPVAPSG